MNTKENLISNLHKSIDQLNKQVQELQTTNKKQVEEIAILKQIKANKEWVEIDD